MAKKAKSKAKPSAEVAQPYAPTAEDKARERKYQVEDGLRTLNRAEEIKSDPDMMRDISAHADEQAGVAKRAATMVKRGLISDRQAAKLKASGAGK